MYAERFDLIVTQQCVAKQLKNNAMNDKSHAMIGNCRRMTGMAILLLEMSSVNHTMLFN